MAVTVFDIYLTAVKMLSKGGPPPPYPESMSRPAARLDALAKYLLDMAEKISEIIGF